MKEHIDVIERAGDILGALTPGALFTVCVDGEVNTVRALIGQAQGLMDDAFTNRAVLQRQRDDMTSEVLAVDVKALMDGRIPDIPLRRNDILYIPSIHDLRDLGSVSITGEVAKPDTYPYADHMTLEDLIIQAGGLREAASLVRVDVSRRIKDPKSLHTTDSIGQMFSFALKDGFVIDGQPGFELRPYDQVFVRRSPGYIRCNRMWVSKGKCCSEELTR